MKFHLPTRRRPILDRPRLGLCLLLISLVVTGVQVSAQTVVLRLQNGDRIAGVILAQTTNSLVLSNAWATELKIPLTAIVSREPAEVTPSAPAPAVAAAPVAPSPAAAPATAAAPVVPSAQPKAAPAAAPIVAVAAPPAAKKQEVKGPKRWKADLNLGTSFIYGTTEQQNYYGTATLTYEKPYLANPKKFFRNTISYNVNYGQANQIVSANQMWGSMKTDLDVTERLFAYNLGVAGYDQVRKIDLQWEVGPGFGYHILKTGRFILNTEVGSQYLVRELSTGVSQDNVYLRFAENATWQIAERVTLKETLAYLPQSLEFGNYRLNLETTVSFALFSRFSLNFTVVNLFNSRPAPGVESDQLQIRSTLGMHF